jgi:hypothetical protein
MTVQPLVLMVDDARPILRLLRIALTAEGLDVAAPGDARRRFHVPV